MLKKVKKFITNKWKLLAIVAIALALILFFVTRSNAAKKDNQPIFTNPKRESITKTLEVSGHVNAKEKARLRFVAGGKVIYIGANEGDFVKKWQTIATIDKASLNKALEKNLNLYMKERWDWEESIDNNRDEYLDLTERRTVDKEQWDLTNTVIDVEIQDIAIQNTALYAPFQGILTHSPTAVTGVQLLATDYFEIVNPDSLVFRAAIDESDISYIMEGQNAELILDSFSEETIPTTVNYISYTSTETSSGTSFVVEFPLNNLDKNIDPDYENSTFSQNKLRIGMNGDINIILEIKENVLTIPTIAITQKDSKILVNVRTKDNESEEREIIIGLETDDTVEILEGLSETDEIVVPEQ